MRKSCLVLLVLFLALTVFPAKGSCASKEFETVMVGSTKVLLRVSEEYGDDASILALMLAGRCHEQPKEGYCARMAVPMVLRNPAPDKIPLDWTQVKKVGAGIMPEHSHFLLTVPNPQVPAALTLLIASLFPASLDDTTFNQQLTTVFRPAFELMGANPFQTSKLADRLIDYLLEGDTRPAPVTEPSSEQVLEFLQREYSAGRLILLLAGNFDKTEALASLEEALKDVNKEPPPSAIPFTVNPGPAVWHSHREISASMCMASVSMNVEPMLLGFTGSSVWQVGGCTR